MVSTKVFLAAVFTALTCVHDAQAFVSTPALFLSTHVGSVFVTAADSTRALHTARPTTAKDSIPEQTGLWGRIKNKATSIKNKATSRTKKAKEDIKAKALALRDRANTGLEEFEERLVAAYKQQTDDLIEAIAIDFVTLLDGPWDMSIATNQNDTRLMMEGSIEELAQDMVDVGLAREGEKSELKNALSEGRVKIAQTVDASEYPLRMKNEVLLGSEPIITFYGQLQFDLLDHKLQFALDELVVLDVKVDLEKIIQAAAELREQEEEQESGFIEEEEEEE